MTRRDRSSFVRLWFPTILRTAHLQQWYAREPHIKPLAGLPAIKPLVGKAVPSDALEPHEENILKFTGRGRCA